MDSELRKALHSKRSEGKLVSQGRFTVDSVAARDRLARFGLDQTEKGLLRLVQLAVGSDVREVQIKQGRDDLRLSFLGGQRFSLDPSTGPEPVRIALLSLLHRGFEQAEVTHGGKRYRLSLQGLEIIDQTSLAQFTTLLLRRRLSGGFWERFRQALKARTIDSATLLSNLRYCPVPITFDAQIRPERLWKVKPRFVFCTRLIATRALQRHGVKLDWSGGENAHFYQDSYPERRYETLRDPFWSVFLESHQRANPSHFLPSHPDWHGKVSAEAALGHLWLPLSGKRPGQLTFVKDGAIVGHRPWPGGAPVHGVISAMALDTDLSGLAVVNNAKMESLLGYLQDTVRHEIVRIKGLEPPNSVVERLSSAGLF